MDTSDRSEPSNRTARLAGLYYLLCSLFAPFALIYVPGKLIVSGDPAATAQSLLAHEGLLRWGIFVGLLSTTAFALAVLTLYRLFRPTSRALAHAMLFLAVVSAPLALMEAVEELTALRLLQGYKLLVAFAPAQREATAMLLLGLRSAGIGVSELFWGLWLLPLGMLVIRSGFLPKWLGAVLLLNGVALVAVSFTVLVLPGYQEIVERIATVPQFGELVFILWILIRGIRVEAPPMPAVAPA